MFRYIPNWHLKSLICSKCGTDKSVKYINSNTNKYYCNLCYFKKLEI